MKNTKNTPSETGAEVRERIEAAARDYCDEFLPARRDNTCILKLEILLSNEHLMGIDSLGRRLLETQLTK